MWKCELDKPFPPQLAFGHGAYHSMHTDSMQNYIYLHFPLPGTDKIPVGKYKCYIESLQDF